MYFLTNGNHKRCWSSSSSQSDTIPQGVRWVIPCPIHLQCTHWGNGSPGWEIINSTLGHLDKSKSKTSRNTTTSLVPFMHKLARGMLRGMLVLASFPGFPLFAVEAWVRGYACLIQVTSSPLLDQGWERCAILLLFSRPLPTHPVLLHGSQ